MLEVRFIEANRSADVDSASANFDRRLSQPPGQDVQTGSFRPSGDDTSSVRFNPDIAR